MAAARGTGGFYRAVYEAAQQCDAQVATEYADYCREDRGGRRFADLMDTAIIK